MPTFLHVENFQPPATEHPTEEALSVAWTGAALADAIDKDVIARPATNTDAAFMAISQISGTALAIPERERMRLSKKGNWKFVLARKGATCTKRENSQIRTLSNSN